MISARTCTGLAMTLVLSLAAYPAAAITEVSNTTIGGSIANGSINGTFGLATSFTTDNATYRLDSASFPIHSNSSGTSDLRLYSDAPGQPGTLLEDLGTQAIGTGDHTFTWLSSGTTLGPDTTYWLVAGLTGSGDVQAYLLDSPNQTGNWTIGDQSLATNNHGTTWNPMSFGFAYDPMIFSVNATPQTSTSSVPEPATATLGLLALTAAALTTIRRRVA